MLIVSAMADVDALYEKVARAGHLAPSLDAWTAQVYRGNTFGDFFGTMSDATDKPAPRATHSRRRRSVSECDRCASGAAH